MRRGAPLWAEFYLEWKALCAARACAKRCEPMCAADWKAPLATYVRRFPFERGFAGKCWRVPLVASNTNGKHGTVRACVVTCLCFRLFARLEKMFDKWNDWRKNKTIRYDFHVVSLAIVWWSCSMNFIYSCNVFYRCLRLNTHISSSNISVQTLPKEGEKHHFFQERNHQKNLTTWLLEKDIAEEKSCTWQDDRMHLYTPDIESNAHQIIFFIIWFDFDYWRTQMIILPKQKTFKTHLETCIQNLISMNNR